MKDEENIFYANWFGFNNFKEFDEATLALILWKEALLEGNPELEYVEETWIEREILHLDPFTRVKDSTLALKIYCKKKKEEQKDVISTSCVTGFGQLDLF